MYTDVLQISENQNRITLYCSLVFCRCLNNLTSFRIGVHVLNSREHVHNLAGCAVAALGAVVGSDLLLDGVQRRLHAPQVLHRANLPTVTRIQRHQALSTTQPRQH